MVKILLAILAFILLIAAGIYFTDSGSNNTSAGNNPANIIQAANNAVDQSQGVQDRLNQHVQQQSNY